MAQHLAPRLMSLVALAGLLSGQAFPQRGPRPTTWAEWRVQGLTVRLALSEAQQQEALAIFTKVEQESRPLEDRLAQQRRMLRDATQDNASAQIDPIAVMIGILTGQIAAIEAKGDLSVYTLLTPGQRQKWDQLMDNPGSPGRRAGGRPGPRPGPGAGPERKGGR